MSSTVDAPVKGARLGDAVDDVAFGHPYLMAGTLIILTTLLTIPTLQRAAASQNTSVSVE
ncbi:hypothetical protein [Actinopolymorpha alba]|uniref:hypothetical protein n=1 Tax=Actinopolymorpha alba TaxID=533267 RepID=UPI000380AC9C|nr:hypothetical protein [Actinopolymorpha alba]